MEAKARASWRIVGLRTTGAVLLKPTNSNLEIEDAECGSLTVEEDDTAEEEDEPPGLQAVVEDGVCQIAWSVVAAGATRLLGIS